MVNTRSKDKTRKNPNSTQKPPQQSGGRKPPPYETDVTRSADKEARHS